MAMVMPSAAAATSEVDDAATPVRAVVIMGVAGNGKTTVGTWLAEELGWDFLEGDDFHPAANIEKMSSGQPLNDEDRRPWLQSLAQEIARLQADGRRSVLGCSALRRRYRDLLREGDPDLFFIHLTADYDTLLERMKRREHFMPPALLQSQFDTLEPLEPEEFGIDISAHAPPDQVVATAKAAIAAASRDA